jgi:hypothetical protein
MRSLHLYRLLFLFLVGAVVVSSAHAQTDYRTKATGMLSVGLGFAGGASIPLEPPEGLKFKPGFAWRLTADAAYPINPTVGAMMSIGLDSRAFKFHPHASSDEASTTTTHISYFSIYPAFKFSAFTLGVNFGFPMGASNAFGAGNSIDFTDAEFDKVTTLIEPRLGVVIPVVDEDIGWLGITLGGGITVSDIIEVPSTMEANYQMVSGHLGLTWQFGIKGTGRR